MGRLVSIVLLVLVIALFPPATLAVVSNNAVPGDSTYPIKRGLEDIIFAVASLNPTMRAWFAAARSDRRFQEVTILIAQGKKASDTLNELVEQAQIAANQIDQVSDPAQKEKLINQLSDSIDKYDVGLTQMSQTYELADDAGTQAVTDQTWQQPAVTPAVATPQPSARSIVRPSASPVPAASQDSPTPKPIVSSPPSVPALPQTPTDIQKAKEELEKIKEKINRKLEQDQEDQGSRNNKPGDRENGKEDRTNKIKQGDHDNQKKRGDNFGR